MKNTSGISYAGLTVSSTDCFNLNSPSMKIFFGIAFLLFSFACSAQQSLRDSLFGGKLKIDSAKYKIAPAPKKLVIDSTMPQALKDSITAVLQQIKQDSIKNAPPPGPVIKAAVFPNGDKAWKKFVDNAVNYVTIAASEQNVKKGHYDITITFSIAEDGSVTDIAVRCSPQQKYFETAFIERMKRSPKWTPATQDGQFAKIPQEQEVTVVIN